MARKKAGPSADHRKLAGELGIEIAERLLKRLPSMAEAIAEGSPSATFSATVKITDVEATVKCTGTIPLPTQDFKIRLARGQLSLFEGEETPLEPGQRSPLTPTEEKVLEEQAGVAKEDDQQEDDPEPDAAGPPKGASQVEAPTKGRKPQSGVKSVSRRQAGRSTTEVPALAGDGPSQEGEGWGDDDGYVPQPNAHLPDA